MTEEEARWEQLEIALQHRYAQMAFEVPHYHYCSTDRYWHRGTIDECADCADHKRCLMDYKV